MREIAADVHMVKALPGDLLNVYLVGDVLVDAGTPLHARMLFRNLDGRPVRAHALTHCHPDHQGSSAAVCRRYGIPLWAGVEDAPAIEDGGVMAANFPRLPLVGLWDRVLSGDGHPVARRLREGDALSAGFVVVETPGHTSGHLSFWRDSDRVLIAGDVVLGMNPRTGRRGLHEHLDFTCTDSRANRASLRRVAELNPDLVCFGHGPPLSGAAEHLQALLASRDS
ncbi:MAG: yflN 2 [Solirubrobacterales bacterium]|nr:yflN 2 [Solirubrobacterales bacterium]